MLMVKTDRKWQERRQKLIEMHLTKKNIDIGVIYKQPGTDVETCNEYKCMLLIKLKNG